MKMNFKPALRYQFPNILKGTAVFYLAIVLISSVIMVSSMSISDQSTTTVSFSAYGFAAAICLFVMGVTSIRSDLRLCLQFGVSRRTAFVSELLSTACVSAVLAAAGELMTGVSQMLTAGNPRYFTADLYQLLFLGTHKMTLSFSQHIQSAMVNAGLMFAFCLAGMFFSLLFWRLNRLWTVVAAISIPLLINGVPILVYKAGVDLRPFLSWLLSSPFCFVLFWLLLAGLLCVINWLLLRRANVKAAK